MRFVHWFVVFASMVVVGCSASGTTGDVPRAPAPPDPTPPGPVGPGDACDDGLDGDRDGRVDESCPCAGDSTQRCYSGDPARAGDGECTWGVQHCESGLEFSTWGTCTGDGSSVCPPDPMMPFGTPDSGIDIMPPLDPPDDAGTPPGPPMDPPIDPPPMEVVVDIFLIGDCVTARCPPEAPYPVGCDVSFSAGMGDERGCVASTPTDPVVYFQAGVACDRGFITGHLICSTAEGAPLDETNCPIHREMSFHVTDRAMCPATH